MIQLVLGGARSGKSRYAEGLATETQGSLFYVATATAGDDQMQARIAHHQQSRPQYWQLIEEPFYLGKLLREHNQSGQTLLIECMTLWLSNWLCTHEQAAWIEEKEQFMDALLASKANIIIVSNEVGSGIIPMGTLSRDFVDQAGWLNQSLARIASRVSLVIAGCALPIKPIHSSAESQG